MRLNDKDKKSIIQCIGQELSQSEADLYLIGSRTDDQKKGGDIDLLILFKERKDYEALYQRKNRIVYDIQGHIGEQKIDITFDLKEDFIQKEFIQSVLPQAILLKSY